MTITIFGKKLLILTTIAVLATSLMLVVIPVYAAHCTTTVTAPASIQDAVDGASSGDVVCLSGTFSQSVRIGPEDSGITLSEAHAATAILDGTGPASCTAGFTICTFNEDWGILLEDGVSEITIENLEIRDYDDGGGGGGQGNAIQAFAEISTSDITVRNNNLHDNQWNGVLVGSEGTTSHEKWSVYHNDVADNGFIGIELTNCNKCKITNNDVDGSGFADILVQARNTIANSGLITIKDVKVKDNTVGSSPRGIEAITFTGLTGSPFTSVAGASATLEKVTIKGNTVTDSTVVQIRFDAFNDPASNLKGKIEGNTINCPFGGSAIGIEILERGASGETGEVSVKLKDNTIDIDCVPPIHFHGDSEKVTIKD